MIEWFLLWQKIVQNGLVRLSGLMRQNFVCQVMPLNAALKDQKKDLCQKLYFMTNVVSKRLWSMGWDNGVGFTAVDVGKLMQHDKSLNAKSILKY